MVVRTWNLFHGNTVPPGRKAYLREMVELVTADRPDIVCLQEIPAWALGLLGAWSGMQAVTARAKRPKLGPLPIPTSLGRALTAPSHGVIRSAFSGQGNAILFPREAKVRSHKTVTLNTNVFTEERGALLGLSTKQMVAWEKERRVCHLVQYEMPDRRRYLVSNLHASSIPGDLRLAEAELRRAVHFADRASEVEETVVVAGDFNLTAAQSGFINELVTAPVESRWDAYGPGIDQLLFRRAVVESVTVWPDERRSHKGRLLSDHAPVEVVFQPER